MNGNIPSIGAPRRSNCGVAEQLLEQEQQHARDHHQQRDGPRVVADLRQHAGGGGERDPGAHGASSTSRRNAASISCSPVRSRSSSGRGVGHQAALAHQQQPVAARRLVHHVAGDEQRGAVAGEAVEQGPEVAPQHGVEPDGRLVEHEQIRLAEQRGGQRDARALAARQRAGELVAGVGEVDGGERPADLARRDAQHGGEVAQVLLDGQVGVDRRRLRHVGHAAAQRRRARRLLEHAHVAARHALHADDRADQRRLAASARAEQAGHAAGLQPRRQPAKHRPATAIDVQPVDLHRIIHRPVNIPQPVRGPGPLTSPNRPKGVRPPYGAARRVRWERQAASVCRLRRRPNACSSASSGGCARP